MKNLVLGLAAIMLVGTNFADAGPLAPKPRVVFTYERSVIEQTGSQTLQELLNTGIYRYFLSGGQSLFVLVNGRPYKTTSHNLESLPVSAIERLEVLDSDGLAAYSGSALGVQGTRGAINVVLRSDLDGFESRAIARAPTSDGGDGWQGSVMWGGEVGEGRMTLGVDILDRAEITAQSREHSQSTWKEGGTFREAKNVSVGGNTIYVLQKDAAGKVTGLRSAALGECKTEDGYTGPLVNPPGLGNGDKGCGFAYGRIMWNTDSYEQKNAVLNLDQPFGETANVHVDVNVTQSESGFRYAPSVGSFAFELPLDSTKRADLLKAINDAAGTSIADADDAFVVAHRFVSHGNRDWLTKTTQFDIGASVEGPLSEGLGYDARIRVYNFDGSEDGNTFVHEPTIASAIKNGNYNLANPFDDNEDHLDAIKNSSLRLATDIESQYLEARLALEGSGLQIGNRQGSWSVGLEGSKLKEHILKAYHANNGESYDSRQVLGTGGFHYSGERSAGAIFTDFLLPLTEDLDLRMTGRADDLDDVGRTQSWFLGAEYKASDLITLRSSLGIAELAPSFLALNGRLHDNPYVTCDPGDSDDVPRECAVPNPLQVERLTNGSSSLEPSETERIAVGGQIGNDRLFLRAEWYRNSISDAAGANTADWSMQNLPLCVGDDRTNCIERTGNDITIHGSYDNVVDLEVTGINAWVGGAFRPSWGLVAWRGSWQHVTDAELRIRDVASNYATPENVISISALANYGSLTAVWRTSYRSGFENSSGTGEYEAWTGHDLTFSWSDPVGLEGTRITAGVFNLTDESLSVDTANPAMVDGPTTASWGRTAFLTLNFEF